MRSDRNDMSRSIGNAIPARLAPLFDGRDLRNNIGLTFLLLTAGEDGWPYVAMLSVGEVMASTDREVRLALWHGSTSTNNLTRTGQATLMLVHGAGSYYLRLAARRGPDLMVQRVPYAFFVTTVEDIQEDLVSYADLTTGISFTLKEPEEVVARWQATVDAIRDAPPP